MAKWDIDVTAARGIIASTENQHSSLPGQKETLGSAIDSASAACRSATITAALEQVRHPSLTGPTGDAAERSASAATNTATAVEHYQQGNLDMAANANNSAAEAPDGEF